MKDLKRAVAFHVVNRDNTDEVFDTIKASIDAVQCKTVVFCPSNCAIPEAVDVVVFPDVVDSVPKQKNFILNWFKDKNFNGFLHLVESCIKFNSKTNSYMDKLEVTMSVLDYNVHLATVTDRCNYVFSKFCPRLTIDVDDLMMKFNLDLPDKIFFTSHSNVAYTTFNFNAFNGNVPLFDERFTIGMFFIIEFLARRRSSAKSDQLYYMNQYLSISDEIGAYDIVDSKSNDDVDQKKMQEENELFKSLNINYTPDNNIDIVLDALYNKLKTKMSN